MAVLDHEKEILEYEEALKRLRAQANDSQELDSEEMGKLEGKVEELKAKIYSKLTPTERLAICRHPARPNSINYIGALCEDFIELHGDRAYRDDPSIIGGFGKISGQKFMIIAQEKGSDTDSRLHRNFGSPHPEGFRKALRLMKMAAKFRLPIVCLIDTKGAYPGLDAEERGQGWAIAENLREMMTLPTPIVVVIVGEAGSGGALAMGVGDTVGMMEHSYYSVISPEGCASILWKDASKKGQAAEALCSNSENLLEMEIIDEILKEPLGGAHHDPEQAFAVVKDFITRSREGLAQIPAATLLEQRYLRFRKLGAFEE